ncbi:MAG: hypothetical protein K2L51_01860, partial [Clostridiales bacterium]|nr:hypothetical protein [Clostridiales bacterium]
LWGIALVQGRSANLSARIKTGIIGAVLSLLLILQLATTHAHLSDTFSSYVSYVYGNKKSAGGVLFGVIAFAIQSVTTPVVSYIIYSLAFVCFVMFCIVWPIYGKRKRAKSEPPAQEINPFVKGLAAPQQTKPLSDTSLFVDTIRPVQPPAYDEQFAPINESNAKSNVPEPTQQPSSSGVQFAPYSAKRSTHEGFKTEAHKILFGDKHYELPPTTSAPVDFQKMRNDYDAKYSLPPIVSAQPDIRDTTVAAPIPPAQPEAPAKPQKRVHSGLGEVPQVP